MKKNYILLILSLFLGLTMNAQLGVDVYTLGLDNANNYLGSWTTTSSGTGFGDWTFDIAGNGSEGRFIGSFSTELDVSSESFGLFANNNSGAVSGATRSFPKSLEEGDVFKVSVGVNFRDGNKGFDLRDGSNRTVANFNVGSDKYTMDGTDLYSDVYDANTVITFTFTQNASTLSWTADRTGGRTESQSGTVGVSSGTITNIRLYNAGNAAGDGDGGSGQRNLYLNSFEYTSLYNINNNSSVTVSSDVTVPYLTIESGSSVTVNTEIGLTVSNNVSNSGTLTANSGSSIIVSGTSTGDIVYNRTLATTNWYLISSPVIGQDIDLFATASGLATGSTASNVGLSDYDNSSPGWTYYQSGASGTGDFTSGDGRSIKLASSSDITFTGTIDVADAGVDIGISSNSNGFNLIGNPYPSFINANSNADGTNNLLSINTASLTENTLWFWDQANSMYDLVNQATDAFYVAPTQGFFVSSTGSNTFSFEENMQSHTKDTFQRSENTRPEINITLSNGTELRDADIFYINNTTTGFDNGYDSSIFGGVVNELAIYTQAVANGTGRNLGIQSLPDNDYENMVIPVGIIATNGAEITIAANATNLPAGINVYLEDKDDSSFTLLDGSSNFTTTLTSDLNGIGRFYMHTSSSALSIDDVNLENISIYTSNNNNLRIVGVQSGNAQVKIYNILGKQVLNSSFEGSGVNDITLPNVRAGVYIIQLETENGTLNKKVIIE